MEVEGNNRGNMANGNDNFSIDGSDGPKQGCLLYGKAYEVVPNGLYKTNSFGKSERVKTLSQNTIDFINENKDWMSSAEKRRVVYNDPAIRLCHKEVRDIEFEKLPLIREHCDKSKIGNILSGSLNSNGFIQITASITDPDIIESIKGSGTLNEAAFSIGYGAKLSNDGKYNVEHKVIEEISLVKKPLFKNCVVDVYASEVMPEHKTPFPNRIKVFCGVDEKEGDLVEDKTETQTIQNSNTSFVKENKFEKDVKTTKNYEKSMDDVVITDADRSEINSSVTENNDNNVQNNDLLKKNNKNMELDELNSETNKLKGKEAISETTQRDSTKMNASQTSETHLQETGNTNDVEMNTTTDKSNQTNESQSKRSNETQSQSEKKEKQLDKMTKSELLEILAAQKQKNDEQAKYLERHKGDLEEIRRKKEREMKEMIDGAFKMTVENDGDIDEDQMNEMKQKFGSVENFLTAASSSDQHKNVVDFFNSAISNNNKKTEELNKLRSEIEELKNNKSLENQSQMNNYQKSAMQQQQNMFSNQQQQQQRSYGSSFQQPLQESVRPGFNFNSNTFGMPTQTSNVGDLLVKASDSYQMNHGGYKRNNQVSFEDDFVDSNGYDNSQRDKRQKKTKRIETRSVNPDSWTPSDYVHVSKGLCGLLECNGWGNYEEGNPIYIRCSEQLCAKTNYDGHNNELNVIGSIFDELSPDPRIKIPTYKEIGGSYCLKQGTVRDPNNFTIKASEDPFEFNPADHISESRQRELMEIAKLPLYATTGASQKSILDKLCMMEKISHMMNDLGPIGVAVKM